MMMIFIALILVCAEALNADEASVTCAFKNGLNLIQDASGLDLYTDLSSGLTFVRNCDFCYTLWNEKEILGQGCWLSSSGCQNQRCISSDSTNEKFCCCRGNDCNVDASIGDSIENQEISSKQNNNNKKIMMVIVAISVLFLVSLILILTIIMTYFRSKKSTKDECQHISNNNKNNRDVESAKLINNEPCNDDLSENFSLEIQQNNILGYGKFGVIYAGSLNNQAVAVKICSQREHFLNEREIYRILSTTRKSWLSQYHGSVENAVIKGTPYQYAIALSPGELGSLHSYLKDNSLTWTKLVKMMQSIIDGLVQLHAETDKPSIVHRDLNSKNILVKNDFTCIICDFGFALQMPGTLEGSAAVGTVRYMSPELLEGSLNLRETESSLKQADVYSLGLLFWEVSRRCHDLYQGSEVPPFQMAFEKEIGLNPTFEQMQVLVSRNKARPLFPGVWKDSNPAVCQLRETIEDSWDQDGEARVTACCVKERIAELPSLWDRYMSRRKEMPKNNNFALHSNRTNSGSGDNAFFYTNDFAPIKESKNDNIISKQQPFVKLQPYQGKNPCFERNLCHGDASDEVLIQKSSKETFCRRISESSSSQIPNLEPLTPIRTPLPPIPLVYNDFSGPTLPAEPRLFTTTKVKNNKSKKINKSKVVVVLDGSSGSVSSEEESKSNLERERNSS